MSPAPLLRLVLAAFALSATSCYMSTMPLYTSGGSAGTQYRTATPTTTTTARRTVGTTGFFLGSGGSSYNRSGSGYGYGSGPGYGYRSSSYGCRSCGYNPCRCGSSSGSHYGHDHGHGHTASRSGSSRSVDHSQDKHSHNEYRIAGGSVRSSQTKPTGYHTLDWYKSRGYDTSRLRLENEHGESPSDQRKKKR